MRKQNNFLQEDYPNLNEVKRVCIVIPTYNESKNIAPLLDKIYLEESKYQEQGHPSSVHVLVVDDSSPDGTAHLVLEYSKENPKVYLLERKNKEGLGAAYIAGMQYALEHFDPDVVFEMDADHSHRPEDIFRMINEIANGSDFVIGSRYVEGGSVPDNWGWHRKVMSFFASSISRIGLGLGNVRDCSGGFRAIKSDVLRSIDLRSLGVKGYAFQIALLEEVARRGFKIKEIPIEFEERNEGSSKMQFKDMLEGWTFIFKKRFSRLFSSSRYGHVKNSVPKEDSVE